MMKKSSIHDASSAGCEPCQTLLGNLLRARGATLAVAESCTGGLLGGRISEQPGCSAYFHGGIIAYDNTIKKRLLDVPESLINRFGAVSPAVARAMAAGVRQRFQTTYGLSVTGIAGPGGGTPNKPVGTVWLGFAADDGAKAVQPDLSGADRHTIREQAVDRAIEWFCRWLKDA